MTGVPETRDAILGSGAGGPLSPPAPWTFGGTNWIYYGGGAVLGSPTGGQKGLGTLNLQGLFVNGAQFDSSTVILKTGGTMTGLLVLSADPTAALGAATKQYVDAKAATAGTGTFLPLSGGTLTGLLTLSGAPTAGLHAATKTYVDGRTPISVDAPSDSQYYSRRNGTWTITPGGLTDAPNDGNSYGRLNGAWASTFDAGTF